MKKIITILLIFVSLFLNAQNNIFRLNLSEKEKIKKINPNLVMSFYLVENELENNKKIIAKNETNIYNPNINLIDQYYRNNELTEKEITKIETIICRVCYENEWKSQQDAKNNLILKISKKKDSIDELIIQKHKIEQRIKDSILTSSKDEIKVLKNDTENPYDLLQRSLYAFSKTNRSLAVFRKMDYNYAALQLTSYLQLDMGLASKTFKIGITDVTETFIPKVSKGNESLTLKYFVTKRKDIIGIYEADEIMIINSLEITGTPSLIIELFLNYWPQSAKIGGYKQGDLAYKELLGDYITVIGISPKLYKIKISKGNMDLDYEKTYGINKKK